VYCNFDRAAAVVVGVGVVVCDVLLFCVCFVVVYCAV